MKINYLIAGAVGVVTLLGVGTTAVSAYRGDMTTYGPNHTEERAEAIDNALKNNDVQAWKEIMTENGHTPRVVEVVDTKEELAKFKEMRELKKQGKYEEAQKIRTELGLGNGQGRGNGNCNR